MGKYKQRKLEKIHKRQEEIAALSDTQFEQKINEINLKQKKCDGVSICSFLTSMTLLISSYFIKSFTIAMPFMLVAAALVCVSGICSFTYEVLEKKSILMKKNRDFIKSRELTFEKSSDHVQDAEQTAVVEQAPTIECVTNEEGLTDPNDCGFEV